MFRKSWSGADERVFKITFLIFIPGILKCLEKPWALKKASFNSMAEALGSTVNEETAANSLDKYVRAAASCVRSGGDGEPPDHGEMNDKPYRLFVDLPYSYYVRLQNLKYMVQISQDVVQLRLCSGLSNTFRRLYTKSVVVFLTFAAIGLFHRSNREAYNDTDVKVTYILLCCTAALEYLSAGLKSYLECFLKVTGLPQADQVAQYSIIAHLASSS